MMRSDLDKILSKWNMDTVLDGTGYPRSFSCRKGRAYLFENVVNVSVGQGEDRLMMSGMHTVADVFCCGCGQLLGWKYMMARDKNQKYKEGKVVLERWRITEDSSEDFNIEARSSDPEYP